MADGTASPATTRNDDAKCGNGESVCARPVAERQIKALGELVGIGLKIARAIERHLDEAAAAPPPLADLNTPAIAYARVARAVRQCILLQDRLQAEQTASAAKAGDLRSRAAPGMQGPIDIRWLDDDDDEPIARDSS